jgi:HEAT repeat protein
MAYAVLILAILLPLLMGAAFLLGRHFHRRRFYHDDLSPVTRQHIDLFQGGQLNEAVVEAAKARLRTLLERGEVAMIEASMRPGMGYVVQVRALTEIGTETACHILERQLQRRLSADQLEQSWYWIDLANGLRSLSREQSLPHLLRCAEAAGEIPLGHFFAAETVCFLGFAGYLRQPDTPLAGAALRVLHRALEGLRFGVQPQVVAEARMGELVETLWDHRSGVAHPLVVRVFAEALRQLRRTPHAKLILGEEQSEHEAFHWQMARLASLEPLLQDYLQEAPAALGAALPDAPAAVQADILLALIDLRADAASAILQLLEDSEFPHPELAVQALAWSREPAVSERLCNWVKREVPMVRRAQRRRRALPPRRPSLANGFPYAAILRALRRHPSRESEVLLILASRDWDPTFRAAAVSSLGWWEPVNPRAVHFCLQDLRRDPNPEVRQAARAALARLGERQCLQGFRQALTSEEPPRVHEAIQLVANEGVTLLWPDLDRLADAEDLDVAHHAREALERLQEELEFRR